MNKNEIILQLSRTVQHRFEKEASGHDWWHIYRVWQLAKHIADAEKADLFIVELAALLHDIADWKFNNGDDKAGGIEARRILNELKVDDRTIDRVVAIVDRISYKGAAAKVERLSKEGQIVQDADRLDAIGAIGIARTFAYGGYKGRPMYDPAIQPQLHATFEAYKTNTAPTINHFYEKLLLLKDRMNTKTGKEMAIQRHQFMEVYLNQFFNEWECRS